MFVLSYCTAREMIMTRIPIRRRSILCPKCPLKLERRPVRRSSPLRARPNRNFRSSDKFLRHVWANRFVVVHGLGKSTTDESISTRTQRDSSPWERVACKSLECAANRWEFARCRFCDFRRWIRFPSVRSNKSFRRFPSGILRFEADWSVPSDEEDFPPSVSPLDSSICSDRFSPSSWIRTNLSERIPTRRTTKKHFFSRRKETKSLVTVRIAETNQFDIDLKRNDENNDQREIQ